MLLIMLAWPWLWYSDALHKYTKDSSSSSSNSSSFVAATDSIHEGRVDMLCRDRSWLKIVKLFVQESVCVDVERSFWRWVDSSTPCNLSRPCGGTICYPWGWWVATLSAHPRVRLFLSPKLQERKTLPPFFVFSFFFPTSSSWCRPVVDVIILLAAQCGFFKGH